VVVEQSAAEWLHFQQQGCRRAVESARTLKTPPIVVVVKVEVERDVKF
jgi:hypothetical protein